MFTKLLTGLMLVAMLIVLSCSKDVDVVVECYLCSFSYGVQITTDGQTLELSGNAGYECDDGLGTCYDFTFIDLPKDHYDASPIVKAQNGYGNWVIQDSVGIIDADEPIEEVGVINWITIF